MNVLKSNKGFTLLEVVIAVAILAVLSYYTSQSIQKAVSSKAKIQGDIDRTSTLRSAMRVIERDIQLAFNYRDPNIELHNRAGKERETRSSTTPAKNPDEQPGENPPPKSTPEDKPPGSTEPFKVRNEVILTHFIGDQKSINFTSRNNVRTQADSQVSDQMEVGYHIGDCHRRANPEQRTQCLIRRTSQIIDNDVTKGGDETPLIEDVTRFEIRYLGYIENAEWQQAWRSDDSGDDTTKKHFPLAVEVTLEVQNKTIEKSKPTAMTIIAEIRFPNNPVPVDPNAASNAEGNPPSTQNPPPGG